MKKPRRKRHDRVARIRKMSSNLINGYAIGFVTGGKNYACSLIDVSAKKIVPVSATMARAIDEVPYLWSVYIAAFCIGQDGKEYMKSEIVQTTSRYYQKDLCEFLNGQHQTLIANCNENHTVSVGWLASPHGVDFTEEQASELFTVLGAWECDK